ncbi:hypothetical protein Tco_1369742 [Tanacetum coccineum]
MVCGTKNNAINEICTVIERVGEVAYKLELPEELSRVHNTFHVSNLKKCHADEPLAVPLDGLHLDDKLHFVEEPLEIVGREVKRLKRSRIPLVKVRWNSKRGPEFTWEREDQFKKKYPHLFTKTTPSSSAASEFHNEASSGWRIDELLDLRFKVAFDLLRDALSAIFGLSELKEGLHYSLHHPTSSIPYPRFTKIIISHYMTNFPKISRRVRDRYYNLKDDDIIKNIFNSRRHKDRVGMKIPDWMISEEMKHTEHYRMYAEVFGIDVPLTQSQPTESTQGTYRTPSAPRRSTRLTPPALVPTVDKADGMILQDTLQMVEGPKNVIDDSSIPRNDDQNIPGTRLDPRSDKESPEVKITNNEEVEITNVVIPINVNEEEEEITDEVYELKQREKGKIVEESRNTPFPTPIRSPRIHTDLVSSDTEKLQELTVTDTTPTPSSSSLNTKLSTTNQLLSLFKAKPARFKCYKSFFQELQGRYGYLFEHLRAKFLSRKSFDTLVDHLQEVTVESLPTMVDNHIKEQVKKQVPEEVKVQVPERGKLQAEISSQIQQAIDINIPSLVDASDDPHDDAHLEGENSAKRPKTSKYEAHFKDVRDPEAPALSLINQDLLYLNKGSSGPEKIVLSLHKFHAIIFNDVDIEERTSRWVNKCVKKFNPYARYGADHWKNPYAKIFYIKMQKEPGKPKEVVYSNSKIIQVIKTYWELGHEHKFITEIVARRANECIVSITEPDYKNLNKNDIEDIYLLIMNGKVPDYAETGIEKHKMFSIIYEPVHGIIYKNSKKEKKVMRHSEIHKFCDATLNRVLEGLKSYNNDVKYGYIQRDLIEDEVEYLKLFVEEIEVRLKYHNQMRRWEIVRHPTYRELHLDQVGDEAVHKELGDRMERIATTASSLEAEQDSDAQTRFEAASKSPMIYLSQEATHLEVGRIFDQERKEADDIDWSKIVEQAQERQ